MELDHIHRGSFPAGLQSFDQGGGETCISSNVGSSISASSGVLTWEEVSTSLAESSSLTGSGVARAREPGLLWSGTFRCYTRSIQNCLGKEFTYLHGHTNLAFHFGGKVLVGLAAGVGLKLLLRERALDSCSLVVD